MNKSKAKGTAAETSVVNYLRENNYPVERRTLSGTNDKGDINMSPLPIAIEVKNCATMKLSEWVKEAETERDNAGANVGVVWHKKRGTTDPGQWYVTMQGKDFLAMLHYMQVLHDQHVLNTGFRH